MRVLTEHFGAGVQMPAQKNTLVENLSRSQEITITVTGRKSGRIISLPIWFVWDDGKLFLLPVKGSETQWYKNVLANPKMRVNALGAEAEIQAVPVTDAAEVSPVVEKFRKKYGVGDVKKYYSKFDVAVVAEMQ
jgi:deazaflavin-dependent oxidoreductase (nitroreductase family)